MKCEKQLFLPMEMLNKKFITFQFEVRDCKLVC